MFLDINGEGEREYIATAYTAMLYEQEFKRDILSDFLDSYVPEHRRRGKRFDTMLTLRGLWAMAQTAEKVNGSHTVPQKFEEWVMSLGPINVSDASEKMVDELQRGLLHPGDSEDGEEEEAEQPEEQLHAAVRGRSESRHPVGGAAADAASPTGDDARRGVPGRA